MPRRLLSAAHLCFVLVFLTGSCASVKKKQYSGETGFSSGSFLKQINAIRARGCNCGGRKYPAAPGVIWNNQLEHAATAHSSYMQRSGQLSHRGRNGMTPEKRVAASGYRWGFVAENIALGQRSISEVIQSWLQSPQHCRNIMSQSATGIGAARSGNYWTLILAAPAYR
ncbi:CAP domain-containing protein [Niabella hirudinis]|uniref:CAP domain-containing protein n=1 Tax=Niabella hirudinis TaxID=1285929 RepID=UPI003EC01303